MSWLDMIATLAAIELVLDELGHAVTPESAAGAASRVIRAQDGNPRAAFAPRAAAT